MAEAGPATRVLTIDWGEGDLPAADRRRWLAAWLVSHEGEEGDFFFDGPGGSVTTHDAPADAVGIRLRWWPPERDDRTLGRQPQATRPFFFESYDGGEIRALDLP